MSLLSGGIELAPLISKIKVDIAGFKSDMEKIKTEAVTKVSEVSKDMESTLKVGDSMSKVGKQATKFITLPLLAAGGAASKLSMDLSQNMGLVSTLLDGSIEEVNQRTADLQKNVYKISNDTGLATDNISNGLYQVVSAFGDTADSAKILEIASKAAKAGNAEVTDSINLLSAVTKGYGDTSAGANQKVSDLAFLTAKLGQTTFPELAGAMGRVVPLAENLKVSQEELFGVMATATGVTGNAAEVSTQFKGILQSLMAPTDSMTKLMQSFGYENGQAMIQSIGLQGTIDAITKAAEESGEPLQSYIGSIEGQTLALALSGAQHDVFSEKLGKMKDATGATDEAFQRVNETTGAKFGNAMNKAKNSLTKLGDAMGPIIEKVADVVTKVADAIADLTPEQQDMIVKIGLTVAAVGPLLKVGGSLISGYAKLKPLMSGVNTLFSKGAPLVGNLGLKLAESGGMVGKFGGWLGNLTKVAPSATTALSSVATGATSLGGAAATAGGTAGLGSLASALGGMAVTAAPFVVGAAAVGAAAYGVYKVLNTEVIPEVDLFADKITTTSGTLNGSYAEMANGTQNNVIKISEATQQGVQSYMDMDDEITKTMYEMKVNNTAITSEIANDMISQFNNMGDSIIAKHNETFNTSYSVISGFYAETGGVVGAGEQAILDSINSKQQIRVDSINKCKDDITAIYQSAANENRSITEAEQQEINRIQGEMRDYAITTFSETEAEADVIRSRMKDYQGRLSAEMASEMIIQANEARDKEIQAAQDKYDNVVKEASKLKQAGLITEEEYQSMITSADNAKKKQVESAEKACTGIKKEISDATPGIEEEVNMQTGKIKTAWDGVCDWVENVWNWITGKGDDAEEYTNNLGKGDSQAEGSNNPNHRFNGLSYVPFDGYLARLHEGERILTKKENETFTSSAKYGSSGGDVNLNLYSPAPLNPSESAQKMKEMLQELALGV